MVSPIPKSVKQIWDEWNLRGCIILSFSLQTFLILCAPLRKRTSKPWIVFLIWYAYLLSDWAAGFAIGLISSSQAGNSSGGGPRYPDDINGDLLAFWSPFLLLHLGGPDTIIAIAMEDSLLWPRQVLGLIFQVIAGAYIFLQSFPQSKLWIPSLLLSLTGIIKSAERTRALYLASLDGLKSTLIRKPKPGQNYAKFAGEYCSLKDANIPTRMEISEPFYKKSTSVTKVMEVADLHDGLAVMQCAYDFFGISKRLIIGLVFSFDERKKSRIFFLDITSRCAFNLISAELNLIYEAFYTKVAVVHSNLGYFNRAISFSVVCVALVFFYKLEKHGFHKFDVGLTYTLLYGAIGLDLISVVMIIFSDWTAAALNKSWQYHSCIAPLLRKYLQLKRPSFSPTKPSCLERTRKFLFGRWSESVSTFNLIDYSWEESQVLTSNVDCCGRFCRIIMDLLGLSKIRDNMKYMSSKPLAPKLWDFIFEELNHKSNIADDPQIGKIICSARGEWILQDIFSQTLDSVVEFNRILLDSVVEFNYDESILMWHIATELCYYSKEGENENGFREYSKTLSDYMLYLLAMQPTMMSSVAGIGQVELWDTCEEAKKFISTIRPALQKKKFICALQQKRVICQKILELNTGIRSAAFQGGESKSVLFDACSLAKELMTLDETKWNLMAKVWVELLSYAASHCRPNSHAESLSKGGELVTFVWLLMTHFGIAEQFQNDKTTIAKLIVGK